jgi:multiple sugar transport system permease protein
MKKKLVKTLKRNRLGILMLMPTLIIILLINLYPLLNSLRLTVYNVTLYNINAEQKFVGPGNFIQLFQDPAFYSYLGFTTVYTVSIVGATYFIGMVLALLVNRQFKLRGVFRTFILVPWILPTIVAALCWEWTFASDGIINTMLRGLGITEKPILFFADVFWARLSTIGMGIWKGFPFMTLTLLAGLQIIPQDLYEAASIDGSNSWRSFRYITMPLMRQVSIITILLRFIWTFNNYEQVFLLTAGGPIRKTTTLAIYSYIRAFTRNELSYAATISVTMLVVLLGFYLVSLFSRNKMENFVQ